MAATAAEDVLHTKTLVTAAFLTFIASFLISYQGVDLWSLTKFNGTPLPKQSQSGSENMPASSTRKQDQEEEEETDAKREETKEEKVLQVFTKEELAKYDGGQDSRGLHLALMGKVFDVEKGRKHYGPNGGYGFFSGRDATRAFVTGEFKEEGLVDHVDGLSNQDMLGLEEWLKFYAKDYRLVGVLAGRYYDAEGRPTAYQKKAMMMIAEAHEWSAAQRSEENKYPSCNSEWRQGHGGRVWCSKRSGGVSRDWAGVPRRMFKAGSSDYRCVCVRSQGAPSDGADNGGNRGDLDNPTLRLYDNCEPTADSCVTSTD